LRLTQAAEGVESVPLAISNNNLGIFYQHLGRGDEALSHINTSLQIADKELREKSGTYVQLMTNKALVLQENGALDEAEATYLKAVDLQTSRLKLNRKSDPDYAHLLNNLASLYLVKGQTEEVEPLLKESLGIYFEKFGDRHPATAAAKADLGNFLRSEGRLDEARTLLKSAYDQRQVILGEAHPSTVQSLEDLAIVQWLAGEIPAASSSYDKVMDYSMAFVNEFFPPMSEVEKTKYWETLKNRFYRYYNFALQHYQAQDDLLEQMINFRLATKGLLLNTTTKIKNTILASGDEELIELYKQWQDQKRTLAIYYSFSKEEMVEQNINLDSLERAANESERQLSATSVAFAEGMVPKSVDYEAISSQLGASEAIVEMVHLPSFDRSFTGSYQYVALVLTKDQNPDVVLLDNGDELDGRYYKYYKNAVKNKFADEYSFAKYWSPLEAKLAGRTRIFFSPDGVYNQINMHTLRDTDGTYLIEAKDFRTIGNPRDLLASKNLSEGTNDAFLLGFPTYGSDKIPLLPGTQKELAEVKSSLVAGKYQVTDVTQQEANEETLKRITSPKVLHIATHGFFMKDVTSKSNVFGVQVDYAKNNPLLRSGLMLAGASPVGQSTSFSEEEDGTLTAYEATNLQLDNTDLVVLSACETGQGDISSGEGVYGLQRAFEVAGADKLIMSLWKVDDAATQQLMSTFYQQWIQSGEEVAVAFRTAQLELMQKYPEPYYWGAFLVVGN
ncbi:MAG: CHAT domain-containing tetratricopeptide repeat protein, partial [Bacteroidota bacterium]